MRDLNGLKTDWSTQLKQLRTIMNQEQRNLLDKCEASQSAALQTLATKLDSFDTRTRELLHGQEEVWHERLWIVRRESDWAFLKNYTRWN
jgi:hypothetical protein